MAQITELMSRVDQSNAELMEQITELMSRMDDIKVDITELKSHNLMQQVAELEQKKRKRPPIV